MVGTLWGILGSERELGLPVIKSMKCNVCKVRVLCCQLQRQVPTKRPLTKSASVLRVLTTSEQMVNASENKIAIYAGMIQELQLVR